MTPLALNRFLVLYTWFPIAALLFFLLLIARFYQKFSGARTFYQLFMAPVVLFGASAVRYASIGQIAGDLLGDLLLALGGVVLIALCLLLYRRMIAGRV